MTLNFEATNVTHLHVSSYGCAGTAAFIIKPRKHMILQALRINYMLITDLKCTFKMFSFCVIAKLAASRSAQLLQMLSCDSQIPLYLLKTSETLLTAPMDVSWTTCAYLTHRAENENRKFLRTIKKRVYLCYTCCSIYAWKLLIWYPRATSDWIHKHHSTISLNYIWTNISVKYAATCSH